MTSVGGVVVVIVLAVADSMLFASNEILTAPRALQMRARADSVTFTVAPESAVRCRCAIEIEIFQR